MSLALSYQLDCKPNWDNQCQSNEECCSKICFKGENNDWKDGLCKPKASFKIEHNGVENHLFIGSQKTIEKANKKFN